MNGMHFWFETSQFKDSKEVLSQSEDGFAWHNGISGYNLAVWLGTQLKAAGLEVSDAWDEDHGWDFSIAAGTSKYLCVCSMDHNGAPPFEAHISLSRERSLFDRIRGANKFEKTDPVAVAIENALKASRDVANLNAEIIR